MYKSISIHTIGHLRMPIQHSIQGNKCIGKAQTTIPSNANKFFTIIGISAFLDFIISYKRPPQLPSDGDTS